MIRYVHERRFLILWIDSSTRDDNRGEQLGDYKVWPRVRLSVVIGLGGMILDKTASQMITRVSRAVIFRAKGLKHRPNNFDKFRSSKLTLV